MKFETVNDLMAVIAKETQERKDRDGRSYRAVYELADKAYNEELPERVDCPVHCENAINIELDELRLSLKSKLKRREKRVEKLRNLKAPEIILCNEYLQLGRLRGMTEEIEHIVRLVSAMKAMNNEEYALPVAHVLGRPTCNDCAYNYDDGQLNEKGKFEGDSRCLCDAVCRLSLYGGICERFKIEREPFFEIRDAQEGTMEKKIAKAVEIINKRNKEEWEAEGCPCYAKEVEDETN